MGKAINYIKAHLVASENTKTGIISQMIGKNHAYRAVRIAEEDMQDKAIDFVLDVVSEVIPETDFRGQSAKEVKDILIDIVADKINEQN